jgi:hypothetical protein
MNPSWGNLDDRSRLVKLLIMDSESLVRLANSQHKWLASGVPTMRELISSVNTAALLGCNP